MKEPTWIKLIRLKQPGIPVHAHPDRPDDQIQLIGSFNVRWPDGTISIAELKTKKVHTRLTAHDDLTEISGPYSYFEVPFNGMEVIYNLHEVELRADEVAKSLATAKRRAA